MCTHAKHSASRMAQLRCSPQTIPLRIETVPPRVQHPHAAQA
jgi:hypothetical protein